MIREIKYRVWDGLNERYCTGLDAGEVFNTYAFNNGEKAVITLNQLLVRGKQDDILPEQYTGLKDKNGKEIYEGDIVNIQGIKYYVDFEHGGFWFNNDNRRWKANRPFTHFQEINDAEVIGNIHENPELLEKGE